MDPIAEPFENDYGVIAELIHTHAKRDPSHTAIIDKLCSVSYAQLDAMMDRVAAALKRDGIRPRQAIAICASSSVHYAAVFLGALRAGVVVAPLAPGSTVEQLAGMMKDAQAKLLFTDEGATEAVNAARASSIPCISLDGSNVGRQLKDWVAPAGTPFKAVTPEPDWAFNIIYSSGTTGSPKGIVQPHSMRWAHVRRGGGAYQYGPHGTTLLATPLYSNTTLVVFFPTLAWGGTLVLMPKFDATGYLQLAEKHHVTHTMLVPVQYQRIMAVPDFDSYDLSSFHAKFCTSAPFGAALKGDIVKRWPGMLVEFYGMTEGGGTCILEAHAHPTKLHTVGKPAEGHDIRLIDDEGKEVPQGEMGEVVGHSIAMMTGYHQQPGKTRDAEWASPEGWRFIRTGDVGRFDEDGFLTLFDRKKDMVISGGFNIYPSDLESVMRQHDAVADVAVVGVPSEAWGETPVAYVVRKPGSTLAEAALLDWFNQQVGKTQRLAALHYIAELPRSAIGKVLKRELRDKHGARAVSVNALRVALESPDQPEIIRLIDELDAYQATLYPPESCYALDLASLKQPQVLFAVARDAGGVAVGCGAIVLGPEYGELKRMYVRPSARGRGVARQLLSLLEARAQAAGCGTLRLETGPSQPEALALYARFGYARCPRFGGYADDPLSVFMEKQLARGRGDDTIATLAQLHKLYPTPKERTLKKQLSALETHSRRFIALSPFVLLATSSANHTADASPRGGSPGFVKLLDDRTLLIPDAAGNNRLDSLNNIVETGKLGLLFMIPGVDETLRINGSAWLSRHPSHLEVFANEKHAPRLVVCVTVEEVYLHCAKAFMRSRLWQADAQVPRSALPTMGDMIKSQTRMEGPAETQEQMLARYAADL